MHKLLGVALIALPLVLALGYLAHRGWWAAALSLSFIALAIGCILTGIFLLSGAWKTVEKDFDEFEGLIAVRRRNRGVPRG